MSEVVGGTSALREMPKQGLLEELIQWSLRALGAKSLNFTACLGQPVFRWLIRDPVQAKVLHNVNNEAQCKLNEPLPHRNEEATQV